MRRTRLSLLDQAISYGAGTVTADAVKTMLGLADRAKAIDLFEAVFGGDIAAALMLLRDLYDAGADPVTLIADLTDFTHLDTRIKLVAAAADDVSLTPDERQRGAKLASRLGMRALSRAWQILFKGYDEVAKAGNALQAAEMVLIRLAYAADLPSPDELIERLGNQPPAASSSAPSLLPRVLRGRAARMRWPGAAAEALRWAAARSEAPRTSRCTRRAQPGPLPGDAPIRVAMPSWWRWPANAATCWSSTRSRPRCGRSPSPRAASRWRWRRAPTPASSRPLSARLKLWTGRNWMISVSNTAPAAPTILRGQAAAPGRGREG